MYGQQKEKKRNASDQYICFWLPSNDGANKGREKANVRKE